jgi:excisionase family DNA binding protein
MSEPAASNPGNDPILTTSGAARLLGVAVSTAQHWIESGALDSWKTPGGHRRVRLSAVMKLIEARQSGQTGQRLEPASLDAEYLPLAEPGYPVPANEGQRLRVLAASKLVGSPPEHVFDRLTWLATQISGCSTALLSLLTARRQWFKSRFGTELVETARDVAFCSHAILESKPLIVDDARTDPRFQKNPLVLGDPHIRFYAGFPVADREGYRLGTLCVLDSGLVTLSNAQVQALQELASIASEEIQRRLEETPGQL